MNKITAPLILLMMLATAAIPIKAAESIIPSRLIEEGEFQAAFTQLLSRAKAGDAVAQVQLGMIFEGGDQGLQPSPLIAAHWYRMAALQGDAHGQVNLGVLYQYGSGVNQNLTTARKWFEKAAAQGYSRGEGKLAYLYVVGKGGEKNISEGIRLLESASANGYAEAQYNLGQLLRQNQGNESDQARSISLLQQAADQEHPPAMNAIAILHLTGELIKDIQLSYRLLHRAAALGFDPAQKNLSKLCAQSPEICHPSK